MNGSGCKNCPVQMCVTLTYRGSMCASQRAKLGLGDPATNADRIREMSDEELYLWAKKQIGCGFDFFPCGVVCEGKCESYSDEDCKAKIMNWLQQPAEGE